jgi:DNA-binding transcriptional LysR family regulator
VLDAFPLLVREPGSGTRAALEDFLAAQHVAPRMAMEIASNETLKQAVVAGLGISLMSLHTIGLELRGGLLHMLDISGTPLMRTWFLAHLQARQLSPAAEAFRYFILEHGEAWLAAHDAALLPMPESKPG